MSNTHKALLLFFVIIVGLFAFLYKDSLFDGIVQMEDNSSVPQKLELAHVLIGNKNISVEIARSEEERQTGLANRSFLGAEEGMFFVFDSDSKYSFWMKDTLIPLDIIWIDSDFTIVDVKENVKPESFPEVFEPSSPARYVLEVNSGFFKKQNLSIGQKIIYTK
jgi:uncharacterized membrane protein (UPF0127 family)